MKHYLFYIPSFAGGGAERVAVMLANHFSDCGNEVSFIVNSKDGPHKALLADNIPLYTLNPKTHFTSIFLFLSLLREIKPDVIHCRGGLCPVIGVLGSLLGGMSKRATIAYDSLFSPYTKQLGTRITRYSVFALSRLSSCTVCVSSDILSELRDRFMASSAKLRVIFNPIDFVEIKRKSLEPLSEPLSKLSREKPFILAAGRFVEQKDYPTMIRAYQRIHTNYPHDLVILGQGPLEQEIKKMVEELELKERVIFPGFAQNPFPVFRAASLFVLSSAFEGFGNVVIESLAVGTPVVSTNCPGGPKEILENGKYGRLVPVGDDESLADAMDKTLKNPLPSEILQNRANDFSLDRIADQYKRIFEKIG